MYTIFRLADPDWIPRNTSPKSPYWSPRANGPCVKPVSALDLMLHCRKGPYQSLMAREDIRIKRVPSALAYALANELEGRIQLDNIYFARSADPNAPSGKSSTARIAMATWIPTSKMCAASSIRLAD